VIDDGATSALPAALLPVVVAIALLLPVVVAMALLLLLLLLPVVVLLFRDWLVSWTREGYLERRKRLM
jgi:uncharacterized membrane protein YedE/YeeE